MTLGQRIAELRQTYLLSQEAFGERLGVTRQTVSKWELDEIRPEIDKIVAMSRIFSVTTDSILVDGISTFDSVLGEPIYVCGIYKSSRMEIVETERFALVYYCNDDKSILGTKLYEGFINKKTLVAVCERDQIEKTTKYAYKTPAHSVITNDKDGLALVLGEEYDASEKNSMRQTEKFLIDHSQAPLPKISEAGIAGCLKSWRMGNGYSVRDDNFRFNLFTDKSEYVFSIHTMDDNIYCGASYTEVFELGLFSRGQYFRIRNYKDNSEPFCRFECNFDFRPGQEPIPTEDVILGSCVETKNGRMFCVKSYTDDQIILQNCGSGEIRFRRTDRYTERFKPMK